MKEKQQNNIVNEMLEQSPQINKILESLIKLRNRIDGNTIVNMAVLVIVLVITFLVIWKW